RWAPRRPRSATKPAKGCRNTAQGRWRDGRSTSPSSASSDRSAYAAKAVVRSWRSSAALTVCGPARGPFRGIAIDDSYLRSRNSQCNGENGQLRTVVQTYGSVLQMRGIDKV